MIRTQDDDDPFIKGEFDVIKELLEKIPEAKEGKAKVYHTEDSVKGRLFYIVSPFLHINLRELTKHTSCYR